MEWNYNIDEAPKGEIIKEIVADPRGYKYERESFTPVRVQTATKCGKVIVTHYLPKEQRWNCYGQNEAPIAWAPLLKHPTEE